MYIYFIFALLFAPILYSVGKTLWKGITSWETKRLQEGKSTYVNFLIPAATTLFGALFGTLAGAAVVMANGG